MAGFKVNQRQIKDLFDQLEEMPAETIQAGYKVYKDSTPVDTTYAKNHTFVKTSSKPSAKGNQIQAKYPYADRLDNGWSKTQAPDGMSKGAIDEMDRFVDKYISRIK
tara:strand:+ start:966 stop:1286 length:321 start_codon:yes stop_codon:yes gene_type:complete